jgi:hypothetical protein
MPKKKDPNAVALGRKGGLAGGGKNLLAWMAKLTPKAHSAAARKAAAVRWAKHKRKKGG